MLNRNILSLLLGLLLAAAPACAQGVLTVEGVVIDKTDKNAVVARDKAIVEAQREAFRAVAARSMSPDAFKHFNLPDDQVIQSLVQDFEIKNERVSADRYVASFTVRFGDLGGYLSVPEGVGPLISLTAEAQKAKEDAAADKKDDAKPGDEKAAEKKDAADEKAAAKTGDEKPPVVEKKAAAAGVERNVLLLPYLQEAGGRKLLWEDPNPWREAWQDNGNETPSADFSVTVPEGDLSDVAAGDAAGAWQGDYVAVEKLRLAYKATEVALVVFDQGAVPPRVEISLYKDGAVTSLGAVTGIEAGGFVPAVARVIDALKSGAPVEAEKPVLSDEKTTLGLVLNISGFAQWVEAQKRLAALDPAPQVDIVALSPRSVELNVTFAGNLEEVRAALGAHGLSLGASLRKNVYELSLVN